MDKSRIHEIKQIAEDNLKNRDHAIVPTDLDYILDKEKIDLRLMPESYIKELLVKRGAHVEDKTDGALFYGLSITKGKVHTIAISKEIYDESETRTRFTIAHELGHYFLHYVPGNQQTSDIKLRSQSKEYSLFEKIEENEADRFAAELLMPEEKIKQIKTLFGEFLSFEELAELIAKTLAVSFTAAKIRLNSLGMG